MPYLPCSLVKILIYGGIMWSMTVCVRMVSFRTRAVAEEIKPQGVVTDYIWAQVWATIALLLIQLHGYMPLKVEECGPNTWVPVLESEDLDQPSSIIYSHLKNEPVDRSLVPCYSDIQINTINIKKNNDDEFLGPFCRRRMISKFLQNINLEIDYDYSWGKW